MWYFIEYLPEQMKPVNLGLLTDVVGFMAGLAHHHPNTVFLVLRLWLPVCRAGKTKSNKFAILQWE